MGCRVPHVFQHMQMSSPAPGLGAIWIESSFAEKDLMGPQVECVSAVYPCGEGDQPRTGLYYQEYSQQVEGSGLYLPLVSASGVLCLVSGSPV